MSTNQDHIGAIVQKVSRADDAKSTSTNVKRILAKTKEPVLTKEEDSDAFVCQVSRKINWSKISWNQQNSSPSSSQPHIELWSTIGIKYGSSLFFVHRRCLKVRWPAPLALCLAPAQDGPMRDRRDFWAPKLVQEPTDCSCTVVALYKTCTYMHIC